MKPPNLAITFGKSADAATISAALMYKGWSKVTKAGVDTMQLPLLLSETQ
jgi:hypothetical protein